MPKNFQTYAIEAFFYAAPMGILPLLDVSARMDLFDLHKAKQESVVENRLGGKTSLQRVNNDEMLVSLTESSTWQLRMTKDSTLEVTHTFYTTDTSTVVKRYDKNWKPLP